jgi:hypothetical protein
VDYLSPSIHRWLDTALWSAWLLPPAAWALARFRGSGLAPNIAGPAFLAIAEGAWLLVSVPLPGTWEMAIRPGAGETREVSLPRAFGEWAGIDVRDEAGEGSARPEVRVEFTSGRVVSLGPQDLARGTARIDCAEQGAKVTVPGPARVTVTAFEDNSTWKDLRAGWLIRRAARPWLTWAGAAAAAVWIGLVLSRRRAS